MTIKRDDAPDLAMIAADDALLDALGRGSPTPDGDEFAVLLASWRTDLDDDSTFDVTAVLSRLDDLPEDDTATRELEPIRPAAPESGDASSGSASDGGAVPVQPVPSPRRSGRSGRAGRWRPSTRGRRYLAGVAAALVLIAGLGVGAGQAGPDSPLWPITQVLYPDRADLRLAEHNIALARRAAADGRYADARRTLDKAAGSVNRLDDKTVASKLRAEIDQIRRTLPPSDDSGRRDAVPTSPSSSSPAAPPPTTGASTPPAGGGQTDQPGQPDPGPDGGDDEQPGGGGIIPGLPPIIPTPTLPIPLPTIPLPTLPINVVP